MEILIRKIDNSKTRQVTFSKRGNGKLKNDTIVVDCMDTLVFVCSSINCIQAIDVDCKTLLHLMHVVFMQTVACIKAFVVICRRYPCILQSDDVACKYSALNCMGTVEGVHYIHHASVDIIHCIFTLVSKHILGPMATKKEVLESEMEQLKAGMEESILE
ncbi:hypothetical protein M5K25_005485 [Dendrobium thyrsiflorum]|uniref:MADS-box domain-containing protein n=1 Tax=Dendrobium thyrsiflorum TaxID=117978 RepID=A0ABD0VQ69_DENTH